MGTSASFARKALSCLAAALLVLALVPAGAFAGQESTESTEPSGNEGFEGAFGSEAPASPQPPSDPSSEADSAAPDGTSAEGGTLAASLIGKPASFVNADVALDGEPVIGSFTVDGLTFAVTEGSNVELVGVSGLEVAGSTRATSEVEAEGSASEAAASIVALPESVAYDDVEYAVASIGAYAFYLSGVTSVELPASVVDVDDRAFRSSDVASVTVAEDNPSYSSFDGALYSADRSSLLLIPEGKQGAVLLPKETEVAEAGKFSHCSLVDAISAEDGAAFASENGLLYTSDLTTLLRVPAGATEIAIREGCTTIAAGAMEACVSLAIINAPVSVASISPDVFTSVPTISLPAATLAEDAPQLTALVALNSTGDDLPKMEASAVMSMLQEGADATPWEAHGFGISFATQIQQAAMYAETAITMSVSPNGGIATNTRAGDTFTSTANWTAFASSSTNISGANVNFYNSIPPNYWTYAFSRSGYSLKGWAKDARGTSGVRTTTIPWNELNGVTWYAIWNINITWNPNGGAWDEAASDIAARVEARTYGYSASGHSGSIIPIRAGYDFMGWSTNRNADPSTAKKTISLPNAHTTYYAIWELRDVDISFDVDSEPGDEDYPGVEKPDETVNVESGPTVIESPKRPGYVFQGWTIPNAEGTEAIDQDLVYQDETDGKWYVDASKLPDYVDDSGRIELTARWTSVISVDVPSAVTFYADVVTEGQESREGAASSAFGQNKVASQSEVGLRIVGLESSAVETQGSTLGADSILKKATSATPSSSADKLFSLYPTDAALTADDLQDPDAVSPTKPDGAVDFALDDILLERSFAADKFTIPAGDTLNLGYRLNLSETGTELDYDKLSTLGEGQSASIANISYCFSLADIYIDPQTEPLWVENTDSVLGATRVYGVLDIKMAAEDLSAHAEDPSASSYYAMYKSFLDNETPFHLKLTVNGVTSYVDMLLIGICQDTKSDGITKSGLTFQMKDIFAYDSKTIPTFGSVAFAGKMNTTDTNAGGWNSSYMRNDILRTAFYSYLDKRVQDNIAVLTKYQQLASSANDSATGTSLQKSTDETVWLPSVFEVFGVAAARYNPTEGASVSVYEPFQYQYYAKETTVATNETVVNAIAIKTFDSTARIWRTRSAQFVNDASFCIVKQDGSLNNAASSTNWGVAPCFAF